MTIYPQELTCLICDRELDSIMEPSHNGDSYTPYNGTVFTSYGHYGSTIFDEMGDKQLSLTICDLCIIEKIKNISISKRENRNNEDQYSARRVYEPYTITEETIKWVEEASLSLLLSVSQPKRKLQDGTIIEYIDHTDNGIVLKVNNEQQVLNNNESFQSNNGDIYTVEWIADKKDIDSSKNAVSLKKEVKKL